MILLNLLILVMLGCWGGGGGGWATVVLLGECGCGKTMLVSFLCRCGHIT